MERIFVQCQGIESVALLRAVLVMVCLSLGACGIWRLSRGSKGLGIACLIALIPGVVALALSGVLGVGWWMTAVGGQVVLAVAIFYWAAFGHLKWRRLTVLIALRCCAVAAILLIMFKPVIEVAPFTHDTRPSLPVIVDRSGSMSVADNPQQGSRYEQSISMIRGQLDRLEKHFKPMFIHFGARAWQGQALEELADLEPKGEGTESTNILLAIETALRDTQGLNPPAIVLVSDGVDNVSASLDAHIGTPVHTVGVGTVDAGGLGRRNVSISDIDAPFEVVKNNTTSITVRVKATGISEGRCELQLYEDDRLVTAQGVDFLQDESEQLVKLDWTPGQALKGSADVDIRKLRLCVPPITGETIVDDNTAHLQVLVTQPKMRVLYIEGAIRSEYKFLMRTLASDPDIQFMSLVRVSGSEFSAYGGIEGKTLQDLPRSDEDFDLFDVLIIGDLDASYWQASQLERIRQFVLDGGGLVMIGGHHSFGPGGYGGTPVEEVLPVLVGSTSQQQDATPFAPALTAEGRIHPIFDGIGGYFAGPGDIAPQPDLPSLSELEGCVTVVGPKAMASVLAVNPLRKNDSGPLVVLATGLYGKGRTAAFTADTTWLWRLTLAAQTTKGPYQRFWGQMVRYLADVRPEAHDHPILLIRLGDSHIQPDQNTTISAWFSHPEPEALASASLASQMLAEDGTLVEIPNLKRRPGSSGRFEAQIAGPLSPGVYMVRVMAKDDQGQVLCEDEARLVVISMGSEMDVLGRNEELLRRLAGATGGGYCDITQLPELVDALVEDLSVEVWAHTGSTTYRLYNFPVLFVLLAGVLAVEWLLRRYWQLQ